MSQRSTSVRSPVLPLLGACCCCCCCAGREVVAAVGLGVDRGVGCNGSSSDGRGAGLSGSGLGSWPLLASSLAPLLMVATGVGAGLRGSAGRESSEAVEGDVGSGVPGKHSTAQVEV